MSKIQTKCQYCNDVIYYKRTSSLNSVLSRHMSFKGCRVKFLEENFTTKSNSGSSKRKIDSIDFDNTTSIVDDDPFNENKSVDDTYY